MRPRALDEFVGQEHLLGTGHILERVIASDEIPSMVFWGPPGVGKTTIAQLIASLTESHFIALSAVTSGVADLRKAVEEAHEQFDINRRGTILFIDEVHRFNKSQQDAILPHVENGTVVFIGATTENPSFEVIAPLLSRARVFKLEPLSDKQITDVINHALTDAERGMGLSNVEIEPDALEFLLGIAAGDARVALNAVELAANVTNHAPDGVKHVDQVTMEEVLQRRSPMYDKRGDSHYDTISAVVKSIRASDPGAAVYWLACMLEAGEDPMFIARRLVISASEDIGMADPHALSVAVATQQAVHFVGLPEGAISLAEATVYLATAFKSNGSYLALNRARHEVRTGRQYPVPLHLRNAATGLMKSFGYGEGYKYSHDYQDHFSGQKNLPDEIAHKQFYQPGELGYEAVVKERLESWWRSRNRSRTQLDGEGDLPSES